MRKILSSRQPLEDIDVITIQLMSAVDLGIASWKANDVSTFTIPDWKKRLSGEPVDMIRSRLTPARTRAIAEPTGKRYPAARRRRAANSGASRTQVARIPTARAAARMPVRFSPAGSEPTWGNPRSSGMSFS